MIRVSHLSKPQTVFLLLLFWSGIHFQIQRASAHAQALIIYSTWTGLKPVGNMTHLPTIHLFPALRTQTQHACITQIYFPSHELISVHVLSCPLVFMYSVCKTVSPHHFPQLPLSQFPLYVLFTHHYCLVCHTGCQPSLCHFVLFCQTGKTYSHSYPHIVSIRSAISGYTKHFEMLIQS